MHRGQTHKTCTGDRNYKWEECTGDGHYTQNQFTVKVVIEPVNSTCTFYSHFPGPGPGPGPVAWQYPFLSFSFF